MARFRSIKNALLAGEISPAAFGRTDLPQYPYACKTLRNVIPRLSGGAYARPGTLHDRTYVEEDSSVPGLIPFVVSQTEAYVLAFRTDFNATRVLQAFRATSPFLPGAVSSVTGTPPYLTANDASTDYDEICDVQYAQSVDVMTLVHPSHKPQNIRRTAIDTFTIEDFDANLTGATRRDAWPYRSQNTTAITMTPSVTTGSGTLTASSAFFNSAHVGAVFKLNHAGTYGAAIVTGFTSSTVVNITVIVNFGATTAVSTWWESAWSDYRGWPRAVGYYQRRRVFAGNATDRDSIWLSETADYQQLSHDSIVDPRSAPTGTQAFTIELASEQLNIIQWISPDLTLAVGTLGQMFIVEPEIEGAGFGADNCKATPRGRFGSAYHPAQRVDDELIFATAADDELRSLVFNLLQNTFNEEPLQVLAGHLPKAETEFQRRKYRQFAWDETRNTLWCVDTAGNLFGMTRKRTLGVTAWHTHQLGGFDATVSGTDSSDLQDDRVEALCAGSVLSIAITPSPTLGINDVWLTVKRKLNDVWVYSLERLQGKGLVADTIDVGGGLGYAGAYYVDCCATGVNQFIAGGGPEDYRIVANVMGGWDHLENVACRGTANKVGDRGIFSLKALTPVDDTGTIVAPLTAPYPPNYTTVGYSLSIGLPFYPVVEPVRLEAGSQIGTAQGAIKRIHELTIRFFKTLAAKVGRDSSTLETVYFRDGDTPMNESPELFSGDKKIHFRGDYDDDGYIYLTNEEPVPFEVSAIIAEGETSDA